jgi:hypothetical protein
MNVVMAINSRIMNLALSVAERSLYTILEVRLKVIGQL